MTVETGEGRQVTTVTFWGGGRWACGVKGRAKIKEGGGERRGGVGEAIGQLGKR